METAEKPVTYEYHHPATRPTVTECVATGNRNPANVIAFPRVTGGTVTRMTILPLSGVISELDIETSESRVSFPAEVRFDLNAKINIQRIILVGGPALDHQ